MPATNNQEYIAFITKLTDNECVIEALSIYECDIPHCPLIAEYKYQLFAEVFYICRFCNNMIQAKRTIQQNGNI